MGRGLQSWNTLVAGRHDRRGVLSYQDGSAEIHRWRDQRTLPPVTGIHQDFLIASGLVDWRYVKERYSDGAGVTDN